MAPRRRSLSYAAELRLMLAPFLLGVGILVVAPAFISFGLAFTLYDGVHAPRWFGLGNFRLLAADPRFQAAVRNSLSYIALAVPLRVLGALGLALLLRERRRGLALYRAAVYLPTVVPDVAYALAWLWIFNPLYGPLNLALGALGLPTPAWLVNPDTALPALAFMAVFQIGEGFVLLLAGLANLPADYYAAGVVDGASRWQLFRHITLPLLAPWLAMLTLRDIVYSFQGTFTPAFIMTGGDPYYATLFLPLLIYREAFDNFRYGMGLALMLVLFLVSAALIGLAVLGLRRWLYGDE
jgi:multiple sugar transport system permease protein